MRDFELDIIRDFTEPDITRGRGKSTPRLGRWIRAHLQELGSDYPYAMWQRWSAFCDTARPYVNIPKNSYQQFVTYVWLLEKNSLVRLIREEPYQNGVSYRYYSVVRRNLNSKLWLNPRKGSPHWKEWFDRFKAKLAQRPPGHPGRPRKDWSTLP